MAADVSSMGSVLNAKRGEQAPVNNGKSDVLITKDLLGTLSGDCDNELDLDFRPRRVYPQKCNSSIIPPSSSSSSSENGSRKHEEKVNPDASELQDLNYPSNLRPLISLIPEGTCLDLKLHSSSQYQSVCTIDKVRFALQKDAEKEPTRKRLSSSQTISPPSSFVQPHSPSTSMFAGGCPGCLFYVITFKANPKCPRCNSIVPCPVIAKKPRPDLNSSL